MTNVPNVTIRARRGKYQVLLSLFDLSKLGRGMCDERPNQSLQSEKEDQLEIAWRYFSLVLLIRLKTVK